MLSLFNNQNQFNTDIEYLIQVIRNKKHKTKMDSIPDCNRTQLFRKSTESNWKFQYDFNY